MLDSSSQRLYAVRISHTNSWPVSTFLLFISLWHGQEYLCESTRTASGVSPQAVDAQTNKRLWEKRIWASSLRLTPQRSEAIKDFSCHRILSISRVSVIVCGWWDSVRKVFAGRSRINPASLIIMKKKKDTYLAGYACQRPVAYAPLSRRHPKSGLDKFLHYLFMASPELGCFAYACGYRVGAKRLISSHFLLSLYFPRPVFSLSLICAGRENETKMKRKSKNLWEACAALRLGPAFIKRHREPVLKSE